MPLQSSQALLGLPQSHHSYTATSKVWAPTLFYTKTCNFLKESNFFSRLQIFLKLESIQNNHSINNLIYYIFFNILLTLRILFVK